MPKKNGAYLVSVCLAEHFPFRMKDLIPFDCFCEVLDGISGRASGDSWNGSLSINFLGTWSKFQSQARGFPVVEKCSDAAKLLSESVKCFGKSRTLKSLIAEPDASERYPLDCTRWIFELSLLILEVLSVLPSREWQNQKLYNRKDLRPRKSVASCWKWVAWTV